VRLYGMRMLVNWFILFLKLLDNDLLNLADQPKCLDCHGLCYVLLCSLHPIGHLVHPDTSFWDWDD